MYDRTTKFLINHAVLSPTQYGFWSNFITNHAILVKVNTCYNDIEKKMYSGLVLLSLAKAYDMLITKYYCMNLSIMVLEG